MGSPSEAVLLRRELVAAPRAYGDRIKECEEANRRATDMLAAVTAELDGLKIAYRMQGAALEEALRDRDEWDEKCRALSRDRDDGAPAQDAREPECPDLVVGGAPQGARQVALDGGIVQRRGPRRVGRQRRRRGVGGEGDGGGRGEARPPRRPRPRRPRRPAGAAARQVEDGVRPASRARPVQAPRRQPRRHRARAQEALRPDRRVTHRVRHGRRQRRAPAGPCQDAVRIGGHRARLRRRPRLRGGPVRGVRHARKGGDPDLNPGSALGVIARERLPDLTNYMSNREAAAYIAWHYGVHMSENTVANAVSAAWAPRSTCTAQWRCACGPAGTP